MKDKYLDKDTSYLISTNIIEYDISSAGYSISRYYKLLDDKTLSWLETLPKKERHIQIGLLCKRLPKYNDALKQAFINIRKEFFEANNIVDEDILAIKKDAIFLLRYANTTKFGEDVEFAEKNTYTSYYYINKKEFYSNPMKLDVKGISDETLELHKDYMLDFMQNIFRLAETSENSQIIRHLVGFIDAYKSRNLEAGYYRELNDSSTYRLSAEYLKFPMGLSNVDDVDDINISYNFMNYIRPLVEIFM
jgi:hypothetical protein